MFASPYHPHARARPVHQSPTPLRHGTAQPKVSVEPRAGDFLVRITPPPGLDLADVSATTTGSSLVLAGALVKPAQANEYVARRRAGAYSAPHPRSCRGVFP